MAGSACEATWRSCYCVAPAVKEVRRKLTRFQMSSGVKALPNLGMALPG